MSGCRVDYLPFMEPGWADIRIYVKGQPMLLPGDPLDESAGETELAGVMEGETPVVLVDEHVPDCVVLMNSRGGDGLGLSFKVNPSGRVFRLEPSRDPNQPRFWCFRIYRCTSAGIADENERSWWGAGGMTRAELPDAVQAIRDDLDTWLANEALAELREWVLEPGSEPVTPARALIARQKQTSR